MMGGADLEPQALESFVTGLFVQYSSKLDKYGRPLMQQHELKDFLDGFTGMPQDPAIQAAVADFTEKIAQQKETASEMGLSPEEAEEGLYLATFAELLKETAKRLPPKTMSSIISCRHYLCGGDPSLLAQSMRTVSGYLPTDPQRPRWRPIGPVKKELM